MWYKSWKKEMKIKEDLKGKINSWKVIDLEYDIGLVF